jgi:hypothetical protein
MCLGVAIDAPFQSCSPGLEDWSGIVAIQSNCPNNNDQIATGFLLGPRLLMTTRDALVDTDTGQDCPATVFQITTGTRARIAGSTPVQIANSQSSTDIVLVLLAAPLTGYYFALSSTSPAHDDLVRTPETPGALTSARVTGHESLSGVSVLETQGDADAIDEGEPILNANNKVVSVAQWREGATSLSVDLPDIADGNPTQFCFGEAARIASTICPSGGRTPTLLSRASPPPVCGGTAATPPFTTCPDPSSVPTDAQSSTPSSTPTSGSTPSQKPELSCWISDSTVLTAPPITSFPDTSTSLVFDWQLTRALPTGTTATMTLTAPGGTVTALPAYGVAGQTWPPALSADAVALPTAPVADGTWTLNVTFSTGATCSASATADS